MNFNSIIATAIIPVILTGIISYIFGLRQNKKENYSIRLHNSIEKVLCSMYHNMIKIKRIENPKTKEKEFTDFFDKYSSESSTIFEVMDGYILRLYYNTEEKYYKFTKKRTIELWKDFIDNYVKLEDCVEKEYFLSNGMISTEYQWIKSLHKSNIIIKLGKELIKGIYDISKGIFILQILFYYFYFSIKFTTDLNIDFIEPYLNFIWVLTKLNLYIICLCMMMDSYQIIKSQNMPKSEISKMLRLKFHSIYNWWDNFGMRRFKNNKYPNMYDKKNL